MKVQKGIEQIERLGGKNENKRKGTHDLLMAFQAHV